MWRYATFSILAIVASTAMILLSRSSYDGHDALVVLCAPSLSGPMEELKDEFLNSLEDQSAVSIEFLYRGSAELLALHQISQFGDVLVAADTHYHQPFVQANLCDQPLTLGVQYPCLIYTELSEAQSLSALHNRSSASWSIPKRDHAAIGRTVAEIIGTEDYQRLIQQAKVSRETVTQVGSDVSSGVVDLGFAWTTTGRQFENLKSVVPSGWEEHLSQVGVSVFLDSAKLDLANRFREFLRSSVGRAVFRNHGFDSTNRAAQAVSGHELSTERQGPEALSIAETRL